MQDCSNCVNFHFYEIAVNTESEDRSDEIPCFKCSRFCNEKELFVAKKPGCVCSDDATFYEHAAGCPVHGFNRFGTR
jgi:hypothetical protein